MASAITSQHLIGDTCGWPREQCRIERRLAHTSQATSILNARRQVQNALKQEAGFASKSKTNVD
jgi:hypothetical protein